jgi:uncharacterized membrane protein
MSRPSHLTEVTVDVYRLSILLTIAGHLAYHLCNRSISSDASPALSLIVTYLVALVCSVLFLVVDGYGATLSQELRRINWASYALGAVVTGIELGFLLAYRAGWRLSTAALYSMAGASLLLVPIGILAYRETLAPANVLGIVLAVTGLALISVR